MDKEKYALTVLTNIRNSKKAIEYYNDKLEYTIDKQSMNILNEILQMVDNNAPIE